MVLPYFLWDLCLPWDLRLLWSFLFLLWSFFLLPCFDFKASS